MPHLLSVRATFLLPSILDFYKRITQPNPDDRPNIWGVMIRFTISRILFVPGILVVNDVRFQALQAVHFWHSCFHSISDAIPGSRISKRGLQKDRSVSADLCLFSTNTIFLSGFQVCFSKTYENSPRYEIFYHETDILENFVEYFNGFCFWNICRKVK